MKMKEFEQIQKLLPKVEFWKLRCEADYYGTSYVIAKHLRLPFVPRSLSGWKHGWMYLPIKYKNQITGPSSSLESILVNSTDQESFLQSFHIKAITVGLPFAYANVLDSVCVDRIENSLLVMPPHSLPYTNHQFNEESYVAEIVALKPDFDLIVVCIHQDCLNKNLWVRAFEKQGIPYVIGANASDKNALIRMNRIFKSFEYMTTNTIGSHLLYAALCGCKVSMYGHFFEPEKREYQDDPFYRRNPEILDYVIEQHTFNNIKKMYPMFFCNPKEAKKHVEWAKVQIGHECMKTPFQIAFYLGWFSLLGKTEFYFLKVFNKVLRVFSK